MSTLAAIRTYKWGEDEQRFFETLSPVFGDDLVAVYQNLGDAELPCRAVNLDKAWLSANGLSPIKNWGWQCGDYAFYRQRDAYPLYDFYWLIEHDVYFSSDPSDFFERFESQKQDVFGQRPTRLSMRLAKSRKALKEQRHKLFEGNTS